MCIRDRVESVSGIAESSAESASGAYQMVRTAVEQAGHKFKYDLHAILTDLVYARVLSPSSRFSSYNFCKTLLEPPKYEIQEIRASERRFYQKITDIYATAVDYDKNSQVTREFYATVQNKICLLYTSKQKKVAAAA